MRRLVTTALLLSLVMLLASPSLFAQQGPPTKWWVNGNGYTGLLLYKVDPATHRVTGTLLGTPVEGYLVGRHLVLHRFPKGKRQIWEGWIMRPDAAAAAVPSYRTDYIIAGTVSIDGQEVVPWYGIDQATAAATTGGSTAGTTTGGTTTGGTTTGGTTTGGTTTGGTTGGTTTGGTTGGTTTGGAGPVPEGFQQAQLVSRFRVSFTHWYERIAGQGAQSIFVQGHDKQRKTQFDWGTVSEHVFDKRPFNVNRAGRVFVIVEFRMENRPEYNLARLDSVGGVYPDLQQGGAWKDVYPGRKWICLTQFVGARELTPTKQFQYRGQPGDATIFVRGDGWDVKPGKYRLRILSALAVDWAAHFPSTGTACVYFVPAGSATGSTGGTTGGTTGTGGGTTGTGTTGGTTGTGTGGTGGTGGIDPDQPIDLNEAYKRYIATYERLTKLAASGDHPITGPKELKEAYANFSQARADYTAKKDDRRAYQTYIAAYNRVTSIIASKPITGGDVMKKASAEYFTAKRLYNEALKQSRQR